MTICDAHIYGAVGAERKCACAACAACAACVTNPSGAPVGAKVAVHPCTAAQGRGPRRRAATAEAEAGRGRPGADSRSAGQRRRALRAGGAPRTDATVCHVVWRLQCGWRESSWHIAAVGRHNEGKWGARVVTDTHSSHGGSRYTTTVRCENAHASHYSNAHPPLLYNNVRSSRDALSHSADLLALSPAFIQMLVY